MILNFKISPTNPSTSSGRTEKVKFGVLSFFLSILIGNTDIYASLIVYGNSTTPPYGFSSQVVVKAYDEQTGTFYVGIVNTASTPSDKFSLAKALRPSPSQLPQFIGIGTNSLLLNQSLEDLLVMPLQQTIEVDEANSILLPILGMVIFNGTPFTQTAVTTSTNDGSQVVTSISFNDATGSTTSGICGIAGNSCYILPALRPNGGGNFGAPGSGIGLVNVAPNPLTMTVLDANTGLPGNLAVPYDGSIIPIKGNGPDNAVFSTDPGDANFMIIMYDDVLCRFYIGNYIASGAQATDIAKSVVVAQTVPEECNEIELYPIAPDSAIFPTTPTLNQIVVAEGSNIPLRALDLAVMHCSTGPDYLIVNGGQGTSSQVGNLIWALPLVNTGQDDGINGTLADANSELSDDCRHTFIQPAINPADLLTNNDVRAMVGSGPLPIESYQFYSEFGVVGDTVYVAINLAPDCNEPNEPTNDTGIFYSQALFDDTGRIARWSPWQRATPFDAFSGIELAPCLSHDGQVQYFQIDAKTGSTWIVEGTTGKLVGYTTWSTGQCKNGLIHEAGKLLCNGSYAGLDLNQNTRGFLDATPDRYALFGGVDQVVITRTSIACSTTTTSSPEIVITNFECDDNLITTPLPELDIEPCPIGAGCVTSLEYSRRLASEGNTNYFFAGTETGLYAFSVTNTLVHQAGFNVDELDALNETPFSDGSWSRIKEIDGAVIDIKTSGARLYVLTASSSCEQPFINTLYSIGYQDTLEAMFTDPGTRSIDIIAQNQVGVFENTCAFFKIGLISTGAVGDNALAAEKEQLILATSNGLYVSNANQNPGDGIIDATNQTEAQWQLINGSANICYDGIGFMDVPIAHTVWPISVTDARNFKTFDRSNINQLSATGNADGTELVIDSFEPPLFNADSCAKKFKTLYPIQYFWSDGGRRFFIITRTMDGACGGQLAVMPFDVCNWDVNGFEPLFNQTLEQFRTINWIRSFGATGLVIAGTNRGLVGLE